MEAKQYFIYLFRVKKTQTVIYVGSCRAIGARLNEHRRGMKDLKHELPIHRYMKDNNLELFKDVEVVIIEYLSDCTLDKALEVEASYYFKYKDTIKNIRPAEIRTGEYSPHSRPIKCLNDGETFVSIREAARFYNLNRVTIASHLNKGVRLKSGLMFQYLDRDSNKLEDIYIIRCIDDNRYFTSLKDCARAYGINEPKIYNFSRNGNKTFMHNGKTFERCNDYRKKKQGE